MPAIAARGSTVTATQWLPAPGLRETCPSNSMLPSPIDATEVTRFLPTDSNARPDETSCSTSRGASCPQGREPPRRNNSFCSSARVLPRGAKPTRSLHDDSSSSMPDGLANSCASSTVGVSQTLSSSTCSCGSAKAFDQLPRSSKRSLRHVKKRLPFSCGSRRELVHLVASLSGPLTHDLGLLAGLSLSALSAWEAGRRAPRSTGARGHDTRAAIR